MEHSSKGNGTLITKTRNHMKKGLALFEDGTCLLSYFLVVKETRASPKRICAHLHLGSKLPTRLPVCTLCNQGNNVWD